jgi:hypothetical protein
MSANRTRPLATLLPTIASNGSEFNLVFRGRSTEVGGDGTIIVTSLGGGLRITLARNVVV